MGLCENLREALPDDEFNADALMARARPVAERPHGRRQWAAIGGATLLAIAAIATLVTMRVAHTTLPTRCGSPRRGSPGSRSNPLHGCRHSEQVIMSAPYRKPGPRAAIKPSLSNGIPSMRASGCTGRVTIETSSSLRTSLMIDTGSTEYVSSGECSQCSSRQIGQMPAGPGPPPE